MLLMYQQLQKYCVTLLAGQTRTMARRFQWMVITSVTPGMSLLVFVVRSFHGTSQSSWLHGNLPLL
jgi:hypothetical protein